MNSTIVRVENLVKWYGPRAAVRDVSFSVREGEAVGLLGPNGSGKSTIFRILTGYLGPSSGKVDIAGHDVTTDPASIRRHVGYVPEDAPLYGNMRTLEFLRFMAQIKGRRGRLVDSAVDNVLTRLELESIAAMPIAKLSRGYRQRVAIAQALVNEPELLVMDEPTTGLDPNQVIAIRDLVRQFVGKQTVLIASHVLSEVQQIATRIMILVDGKLLSADALHAPAEIVRLRVRVFGPEADVRACLGTVPGLRAISAQGSPTEQPGHYIIEANPQSRLTHQVAEALLAHNLQVSELALIPPDLEGVYLAVTRRRQEMAA